MSNTALKSKPRLLDLFCGAGGAAMGYHRAGFEVIGVDINPQPNYPFEFVRADALEVLDWMTDYASWRYDEDRWPRLTEPFSAVHASPPCQAFTDYRRKGHGVGEGYPNLIPGVRYLLESYGSPYVIENVEKAAPELRDPVTLCGSMFGLDVRRHRLFETNWPLEQPRCDHASQIAKGKRFPGATNRHGRYTVEVGVWRIPLHVQQAAMGMDWSALEELSEAVPPAYTEYVGAQLLAYLKSEVEAAA